MNILDLQIFSRVAAARSLSAAGQDFDLTPGTISKRLQALEDDLGVRLFYRTTRSVRITEEGKIFLAHIEKIIDQFELARAAVSDKISNPKGKIRICAPTGIGRRQVAPAVSAFMAMCPDIELQVDLLDKPISFPADGYDLAIRAGKLADSSVIAKRLAADPHILVASPRYLEVQGTPNAPEDLRTHSCFAIGDRRTWTFEGAGREHSVRVSGRMRSNSVSVMHQAAIDGHGILLCSLFGVGDYVESGKLIQVLKNYEITPDSSIYAIYQQSRHEMPRMRALLEFLAQWFKDPSRVFELEKSWAMTATMGPVPPIMSNRSFSCACHADENQSEHGPQNGKHEAGDALQHPAKSSRLRRAPA